MAMAEFLTRAEAIAKELHAGQLYGSRDYIEAHIEPAATLTRRLGYGDTFQSVVWLHDTVEDTEATLDYLLSEGIPEVVVHAVDLLSKKPGQSREEYIGGILTDEYAIVGKFCDSSVNYASTILLSETVEDAKVRQRSMEYADNLAMLFPHLPDPEEPAQLLSRK
jgi:hypothetical protein